MADTTQPLIIPTTMELREDHYLMANLLSRNLDEWLSFLSLAGRMYRYSFSNQLLIYIGQPDAKAVAGPDIWNTAFGREIRADSEGIFINNGSGGVSHIYDISETEESQAGSKPVFLWQLQKGNEGDVLKALGNSYPGFGDLRGFGSMGKLFLELTKQLALRHSNPTNHPEHTNLLALSSAYAIMTRCNIADLSRHIKVGDFGGPFSIYMQGFGIGGVYRLGGAVRDLTEGVLKTIELELKRLEKEKEARHGVQCVPKTAAIVR